VAFTGFQRLIACALVDACDVAVQLGDLLCMFLPLPLDLLVQGTALLDLSVNEFVTFSAVA
jgi:hypothetical protein